MGDVLVSTMSEAEKRRGRRTIAWTAAVVAAVLLSRWVLAKTVGEPVESVAAPTDGAAPPALTSRLAAEGPYGLLWTALKAVGLVAGGRVLMIFQRYSDDDQVRSRTTGVYDNLLGYFGFMLMFGGVGILGKQVWNTRWELSAPPNAAPSGRRHSDRVLLPPVDFRQMEVEHAKRVDAMREKMAEEGRRLFEESARKSREGSPPESGSTKPEPE